MFVSAAAPSCGGAAELQQADVRPAGRSDREHRQRIKDHCDVDLTGFNRIFTFNPLCNHKSVSSRGL